MSTELIFIGIVSPVITAVVAGWLGWFFGRKRQKIDNIDAATDTFNKIIEQLRKEIGIYQREKDSSGELIKQQSQQIKELTGEVRRLSEEVEGLLRWKKENIALKKKIEKYEKLLTTNNIDYLL